MTEYDDGKSNEELTSAIIVSTCQLVSKSVPDITDHMHKLIVSTEPAPKQYAILCGSFAEFYIRPLNPCISDIDFLLSKADTLAFSGDYPVLPSDVSGLADEIVWYKIEPYQRSPGFARLRFLGAIYYDWKCKGYEFRRIHLGPSDSGKAYMNLKRSLATETINGDFTVREARLKSTRQRNGPASVCKPDDFGRDDVLSVWCPLWPREAENWPLRPKNYGWPSIATISEVVQQGCHVVYAQHRSSKDDERQFRLSFSVAEVILLQSWNKIQQIVYHMLRFLSKSELIEKDCPKEDEVLCTYQLKTLMLWTCEEMPPEWWNSSSVISICCKLLKKLSEWLKRKHCPNYFIPEANLFNRSCNQTMYEKLETKLNKFFNSSTASDWFMEKYIKPFIRTHIRVRAYDVNGRIVESHIIDCMLRLLEFRKISELDSLNMMLSFRFTISHVSCRIVFKNGFSSGLRQMFGCGCYMKDLDAKTDSTMSCLPTIENIACLTYYENVLYILHTAYGICVGEISLEGNLCVELIASFSMQPKIVRSKHHNFPKTYTEKSSLFQFLRAHEMLKNLTGLNGPSEFQLVSTMSKVLLGKTLQYYDSHSNRIERAALSYLAALHFTTSEYQKAMHLCLAVLSDHASQKNLETLNAGCLFFIDDVSGLVGLCVLHKKITENKLHYVNRRLYFDLRLSPRVFAYYLGFLCSERLFKHSYFQHDLPVSLFPFDEYIKILIMSKCTGQMMFSSHCSAAAREIVYQRKDSFRETESTKMVTPSMAKHEVIDILLEYALENMSSFYRVFHKDFRINCDTVDCYRALYLCQCRRYSEMVCLCDKILHRPDVQNDLKEFAFANVLLLPPFHSYFDGDVQSLLGLHTLFYYLSPLNVVKQEPKLTAESTFVQWFAIEVYQAGMQLSTSISRQNNSIKCFYFLGRHFLARYLKVRFCIECDLPYLEALTEFSALKTRYPFEYIIRQYLQQKICVVKK